MGQKQLAAQEGIELVRKIRADPQQSRDAATRWGELAVIGNVVLVPLNVIVNAFDLKAASTYQALVRVFVQAAYQKTSASGT